MFCICETRVQLVKVEQFWSSLNYKPIEIQEARGHFSGIWIHFSAENTTIMILNSMHQAITFLIHRKDEVWRCTFIYASPILNLRIRLWNLSIIKYYPCSLVTSW